MKAEIQKVLEMNKSGTITDEQAAALLEELARKEKKSGTRHQESPASERPFYFGKPFADLIHNTLNSALGGLAPQSSDADGNNVHMSKLESPFGKDFVFTGNTLSLSSVTRLELNSAEMSHTSVTASKLDRVRVTEGKFSGCSVNSSSMDRIDILRSSVEGVSVNAAKFSRLTVANDSQIRGLKVEGSNFKVAELTAGSEWSDSAIVASEASKIVLSGSKLTGCRFDASQVSDLKLEGSRLDGLTIQTLRMDQIEFVGCEFSRVTMTGSDSWRWHDLSKTRFENCKLEGVRFSDCRMKNTIIRNVTLNEVGVRGTDFSGMTIDGNEAFLRAAGLGSGS